jgi:hypothetical protein
MPAGHRTMLPAHRRLLTFLASLSLLGSGLVALPAEPGVAAPSTPARRACVAEQPTAAGRAADDPVGGR